jgi:hypothetical protein
MKVGDLVKRKFSTYPFHGIITKVYESTVEVMWFADDKFKEIYVTMGTYFLEKVS